MLPKCEKMAALSSTLSDFCPQSVDGGGRDSRLQEEPGLDGRVCGRDVWEVVWQDWRGGFHGGQEKGRVDSDLFIPNTQSLVPTPSAPVWEYRITSFDFHHFLTAPLFDLNKTFDTYLAMVDVVRKRLSGAQCQNISKINGWVRYIIHGCQTGWVSCVINKMHD